MAEHWQKLIEALVKKNIVKKKTLNDAIVRYRSSGDAIEKVLVNSGLITREQLLELKKEAFLVEPHDLQADKVDPEIGQLLPQSMADRYGVLCVERNENTITLVSAEPLDAIAMDYLRMRSGFEIKFRIAYAADIEDTRRRIYAGEDGPPVPAAEFHTTGGARRHTSPLTARGPLNEVANRDTVRRTVSLPDVPARASRPPNGPTPSATPVVPMGPAIGVRKGTSAAEMSKDAGPRVVPLVPKATCGMCAATVDLTRTLDTRAQLEKILHNLMNACDCEATSLLVLEADGRSLFFKHAVGRAAESIVNIVVPLNEASIAGWVLGHRKPLVVNNTEADPLHNKETDKMIQYMTHRIAAAPVMWGEQLLGVVEVVNKRLGGFAEGDVEALRIAAAQIAIALHNETLSRQLSGLVMETVNVLAELLQMQGKVSRAHLVDVAQLATAMGREAGLDEEQMEILSHAGILHDIGTLSPGATDSDESHTHRGAELLSRVPMLANLVPHIRMHHERWNGTGPQRLREVQIPLPARILSVAEAWYERPQDDFFAFLDRFGNDFDPALRDVFLRAWDTIQMARGDAASR